MKEKIVYILCFSRVRIIVYKYIKKNIIIIIVVIIMNDLYHNLLSKTQERSKKIFYLLTGVVLLCGIVAASAGGIVLNFKEVKRYCIVTVIINDYYNYYYLLLYVVAVFLNNYNKNKNVIAIMVISCFATSKRTSTALQGFEPGDRGLHERGCGLRGHRRGCLAVALRLLRHLRREA